MERWNVDIKDQRESSKLYEKDEGSGTETGKEGMAGRILSVNQPTGAFSAIDRTATLRKRRSTESASEDLSTDSEWDKVETES